MDTRLCLSDKPDLILHMQTVMGHCQGTTHLKHVQALVQSIAVFLKLLCILVRHHNSPECILSAVPLPKLVDLDKRSEHKSIILGHED